MGRVWIKTIFAMLMMGMISSAHAQLDNPNSFSFDGRLLDDSTGNPMSGPRALKVQVFNPAANCLLFEEDHASVPLDADGAFSIRVGTGTRNTGADGGLSWKSIFSNKGVLIRASNGGTCGTSYTPSPGDSRKIRITVDSVNVLTPDFTMTTVPFATTADTLQGLTPADLVLASGGSAVNGFIKMNNQAAVRFADAVGTNYVNMRAPASLPGVVNLTLPNGAGTSGQVLATDGAGNLSWTSTVANATNASFAANAGQIQGFSISGAAPSTNQVLTWNGSTWMPMTVAGTGGGSSNATQLQGRAVSPAAPSVNQVLSWNGSEWLPMTIAGTGGGTDNLGNHTATQNLVLASNWLSGDGGNEGLMVNGNGQVGIGTNIPSAGAALDIFGAGSGSSSFLVPRDSTGMRPAGINGMIRYNTTLSKFEVFENGAWTNMVATGGGGSVTAVVAGMGLLGGVITTTGSLSVDVGTTANKIVQLNGSAQLPAVDAALLLNVNAAKLATRMVSSATPTTNQVLMWNGSAWAPASVGMGDFMANGSVPMSGNLNMATQTNVKIGTYTSAEEGSLTGGLFAGDAGRVWYNSDMAILRFWDGSSANSLSVGGGSPWSVSGADIYYNSGRVGIGTSIPVSGAALEVAGTGTDTSILVPRGPASTRPPSAVNGMIRYNTNISRFEAYENAGWKPMIEGPIDHGVEVLTSSNPSWVVPIGVRSVKVIVIAGGGGGCTSVGGGGSGGAVMAYVNNLAPGSTVNITVGAGGAFGTNGANGSGSSFGSFVTTTAGLGCVANTQGADGSHSFSPGPPMVSGSPLASLRQTYNAGQGGSMSVSGQDGIVVVEW